MQITWTNAHLVAAGVGRLAGAVETRHVQNWGDDVGRSGTKAIQRVIQAGGMNPTKKGGPRIKSGEMFNSAEDKTISGGGVAFVRAGYGIDTTTPRHTLWQEGGTRRGITPMLSIVQAELEMEKEMAESGDRMLMKIRTEWDAI